MKCYVITDYIDPSKLDWYSDYPQKASSITTQFGGRFVRLPNSWGCPEDINVVIEFDSKEKAQQWYSSPEYTAVKIYV